MRIKEKLLLYLSCISLISSIIFLLFQKTFEEKIMGFIPCLLLTSILLFINRYYIIECLTNSKYIIDRLYDRKIELYQYTDKLNKIINKINTLQGQKKELKNAIKDLNDEILKLKKFENFIYDIIDKDLEEYSQFNIKYVDSLDGLEFEEYIRNLLLYLNFTDIKKTKASNDYGVDILATKDDIKYAIQCKNYNNPLGNSCIQEVYSGNSYYSCDIAVVITNSHFTKNAINLAKTNNVLLWDRNILIEMLKNAKETFIKTHIDL